MSKTLVVYYSLTNHTRTVANELAKDLGAGVAEIRDVTPRTGAWGKLRSTVEAVFRLHPRIAYLGPDPAAFDLVVIGTPVWASRMASPVRTFLRDYGKRIRKPAVFCTYGGSGATAAALDMGRLLDVPPVDTLLIRDDEIASGDFHRHVREFTKEHFPSSPSLEPVRN
jgi:flavodoxin